jgi:hypothetical protein
MPLDSSELAAAAENFRSAYLKKNTACDNVQESFDLENTLQKEAQTLSNAIKQWNTEYDPFASWYYIATEASEPSNCNNYIYDTEWIEPYLNYLIYMKETAEQDSTGEELENLSGRIITFEKFICDQLNELNEVITEASLTKQLNRQDSLELYLTKEKTLHKKLLELYREVQRGVYTAQNRNEVISGLITEVVSSFLFKKPEGTAEELSDISSKLGFTKLE